MVDVALDLLLLLRLLQELLIVVLTSVGTLLALLLGLGSLGVGQGQVRSLPLSDSAGGG